MALYRQSEGCLQQLLSTRVNCEQLQTSGVRVRVRVLLPPLSSLTVPARALLPVPALFPAPLVLVSTLFLVPAPALLALSEALLHAVPDPALLLLLGLLLLLVLMLVFIPGPAPHRHTNRLE